MPRAASLVALPLLLACPASEREPAVDAEAAAEAFQLGRGRQLQHAADPSQERLDAAIAELERAARLDATVSAHHYWAGRAREERGDEVLARDHYAAAVARDDGHGPAHWRLGRLLHGEGRLEDARRHLERARELDLGQDQPGVCVDLGRVCEDLDRLEAARDLYRRALELREPETQAHFRLAQVLRQLGDEDGADAANARYEQCWALERELAAARGAARRDPRSLAAHLAVARLSLQLQRREAARAACRRALALQPDQPEAQRLLRELEDGE